MSELEKVSQGITIPERTRFQIERFVIGQHDTPEMQYRQVLIEAQDLIYKIQLAKIGIKKTELEIQRLLATGDEMEALEAEEKKLGLELTKNVLVGAEQELAVLEEIYKQSPKFSQEDIEANQPEYWSKRLHRQAKHELASRQTGVGANSLQSLEAINELQIQELQ